jgi:hypothetical protein
MTELENGWLDYAWMVLHKPLVVNGREHEEQFCCFDQSPRRQIARWPGYLGSSFETGRVLLVGEVHNGNARGKAGLFTKPIKCLEAVAKNWIRFGRSTESDALYLTKIRETYPDSMTAWRNAGGQVWRNLLTILECLKLTPSQIAFTNLAKCYTDQPDHNKMVLECDRAFPMQDLVKILKPLAVFIAKGDRKICGQIQIRPVNSSLPLLFWFGNANVDQGKYKCGDLNSKYLNAPLKEWLPAAVLLYRQSRGKESKT